MEYQSSNLIYFGLAGLLFWSLDYLKVFTKAQLILPTDTKEIGVVQIGRYSNFILGLVAWCLISYSLMGPRKPIAYNPDKIKVNDIFIVLDVSRSMLADDILPNRLEVAKDKLREFAALRPTDRIGLIVFAEKVFTLLPLTTDPNLIAKMIKDVRVGGPLGSGTNIGDSLGLAVARAQVSQTKNKVIILLTDGVENVGNMTSLQAANMAKDYGVKIYTIGIGTDSETARIPVGPSNSVHFQTIPGGSIDTKTMQEIAEISGGQFYLVSDGDSLQDILSKINDLERTEIEKNKNVVYDELFYQYLWWGVLLIMFSELCRRFLFKEVI